MSHESALAHVVRLAPSHLLHDIVKTHSKVAFKWEKMGKKTVSVGIQKENPRARARKTKPPLGATIYIHSHLPFVPLYTFTPFVHLSLLWQWEAKTTHCWELSTKLSWCNNSYYLFNVNSSFIVSFLCLFSYLWFDHPNICFIARNSMMLFSLLYEPPLIIQFN